MQKIKHGAAILQTRKGDSLLQVTRNKEYTILAPPNPTYWPTSPRNRPDILDIFVTKIPNIINHLIKNLLGPCSDHSPGFLTLNTQSAFRSNRESLINGIMNWEKFYQIINLNTRLKTLKLYRKRCSKIYQTYPISSMEKSSFVLQKH